ncbi:MAG: discoidin domain-containing protein [Ruminococcaceae bacterium]|nr:discoidin domain-containing protein [Oscillospiraceae bacterium]
MKRAIVLSAFMLLLLLTLCFTSCGEKPPVTTEPTATTDAPATDAPVTEAPTEPVTEPITEPVTEAPEPEEKISLDGKRVIIIGNSYVFNGKTVITQSSSVYTQAPRSNDKGYFYQLCKANGHEVTVTNWTFGGHGLTNLFGGTCGYSSCPLEKGSHEKFLTNKFYDYVIVAPGGGSTTAQNILTDFDYIIKFFRDANPDVKIICLANLGVHGYSSFGTDYPEVYNNYKAIEDKGVIIADWGGVVARILKGVYTVPDSTLEYTQNTFIVKDGYHPNMLSGYLSALAAYCAITGEKAEGQPYDFYGDTKLNSAFNVNSYISSSYLLRNTNFDKVFASPQDMKSLQQLLDKHHGEKEYLKEWNKNASATGTEMLTAEPKNGIISVIFSATKPEGNGWRSVSSKWTKPEAGYSYFSGIRGDADAICSLEGTTGANGLTAAQKADIGDTRYGVSAIGLSHMKLTKYLINGDTANKVESTSLMNLVNGHYGSSYLAELYFDNKTYNVKGEEDASAPYTALITLNFGSVREFEAMGYSSSNMRVIPQAQDVYVSEDGVSWTKVESACYDTRTLTLYPIEEKSSVKDPWNNNTPLYETLFGMGGAKGKYIRIGIIRGANADYTGVNIRELMVFGK